MAYGNVNIPGVSWAEFNAVKKTAEEAKKAVADLENTLSSVPIPVGGGNI